MVRAPRRHGPCGEGRREHLRAGGRLRGSERPEWRLGPGLYDPAWPVNALLLATWLAGVAMVMALGVEAATHAAGRGICPPGCRAPPLALDGSVRTFLGLPARRYGRPIPAWRRALAPWVRLPGLLAPLGLAAAGRSLAAYSPQATSAVKAEPAPPGDVGAARPAPVPAAVLSGHVLDAETGMPLAGVTLTILDWDSSAGRTVTVTTDSNGWFRFVELRPSGNPAEQVRLVAASRAT